MKCPNCGKKMKKATCAKCGYDPAAKVEVPVAVETPTAPATPVMPTVPTYKPSVSYYTYDPANPNVWYPMATNAQGQPCLTPTTTQIQFAPTIATAPQVQTMSMVTTAMPAQQAVQQPVQQSVEQTAETDDLATAVGKRAEKIAKKMAKKAEKKMTKGQKKAAKALLDAVDKVEEKTTSNNVLSRIFAVLLIAACVFMFGFMDVNAITELTQVNGNWALEVSEGSLIKVLIQSFQADETLFGFLPAFVSKDGAGTAYNLSVYITSLCGIFAVLYAIFAVFSGEKAPRRVRRALFFLGAGALDYTVSLSALIGQDNQSIFTDSILQKMNLFNLGGYQVEMLPMIIGVACLLLSFLFLIFRRREKKTQETNQVAA